MTIGITPATFITIMTPVKSDGAGEDWPRSAHDRLGTDEVGAITAIPHLYIGWNGAVSPTVALKNSVARPFRKPTVLFKSP